MGSSVHRTARIGLRLTRGQARRCYGLLRAAGDVWAALIEVNAARFDRGGRPIANYQEWCREIAGVTCGELSVTAMRSVVRRYSEAFFETARRKRRGERARYPRRRRALFPTRWYRSTFRLDGRRVRLSVATGRPDLWVRLARPVPYPLEQVRSVTFVAEAGRLFLDVTAAVPVAENGLEPGRVGGVDIGIIHPFATACDDEALVVSGRAVRAEERVHLADTKARAARMCRKAPRRGQRGSRRWRQLRATQRRAEARHRRRIRFAHRTCNLLDVPRMLDHRQAIGTELHLPGLWTSRAPRRPRCSQHRRQKRWDHAHARARHAPSSRPRTCPA